MVKPSLALFLLLVTLLAGCATRSDVASYWHPGDGLRTDIITDNPLDPPDATGRELLWLNASRVFKDEKRFSYFLEITYAAREETGYLDIAPGPSLVITTDGREMKFGGNGSRNLRKSKRGLLNERALYVVQADDLRSIAGAQKVIVSVSGKNGMVQRDFRPENQERFKKFVEKFVAPPR